VGVTFLSANAVKAAQIAGEVTNVALWQDAL
jgi:hypothetical protein